MTEAQAVEAILETWKAGWDILHPADCPVTFENEAFTSVSQWARVTIVHTDRRQMTLGPVGSRRFETRGRVAIQLFADLDQGIGRTATLNGDARAVLEGKTIVVGNENVALFGGATTNLPTDGRWSMSVVNVPFFYTEVR